MQHTYILDYRSEKIDKTLEQKVEKLNPDLQRKKMISKFLFEKVLNIRENPIF